MRVLASEEIRAFRMEVFWEHVGPQAAPNSFAFSFVRRADFCSDSVH